MSFCWPTLIRSVCPLSLCVSSFWQTCFLIVFLSVFAERMTELKIEGKIIILWCSNRNHSWSVSNQWCGPSTPPSFYPWLQRRNISAQGKRCRHGRRFLMRLSRMLDDSREASDTCSLSITVESGVSQQQSLQPTYHISNWSTHSN